MREDKNIGFTLIEILVLITIVIVLFSISILVLSSFRAETELNEVVERVVILLEDARTRTVSSQDDSRYGVYFDDQSTPNALIFFKGSSYSLRDPSFDEDYFFPSDIRLETISLAEGNEVVFQKITGETSSWGYVALASARDLEKTKTVYVSRMGQIDMKDSGSPSDESRNKDSRHVHFSYTRTIDVLTESVILSFEYNGSVYEYEIPMDSNMRGDQFYWQGEIEVDDSLQRLTLQTQRLNNPDTEFCIHRDRRYNDKALSVSLSGDSSGPLISYSADGLNTNSSSIYTGELIWE